MSGGGESMRPRSPPADSQCPTTLTSKSVARIGDTRCHRHLGGEVKHLLRAFECAADVARLRTSPTIDAHALAVSCCSHATFWSTPVRERLSWITTGWPEREQPVSEIGADEPRASGDEYGAIGHAAVMSIAICLGPNEVVAHTTNPRAASSARASRKRSSRNLAFEPCREVEQARLRVVTSGRKPEDITR